MIVSGYETYTEKWKWFKSPFGSFGRINILKKGNAETFKTPSVGMFQLDKVIGLLLISGALMLGEIGRASCRERVSSKV